MRRVFETAIGRLSLEWGTRGVTRLSMTDEDVGGDSSPVALAVTKHLAGEEQDLGSIAIDVRDEPPFHQKVYAASRRVPSGRTITYGELARRAGSPDASRAVGQAMARNPLLLIVPCHRVVSGDGIGGFSAPGGISTKERMLAIERASLTPDVPFDCLRAVADLREGDPKLGAAIDRIGPYSLRVRKPRTLFEALSRAIIYQQLSGKAAGTIYARFESLFGSEAPSAELMQKIKTPKLRSVGLSAAKARAVLDLAAKTRRGILPPLEDLRSMRDEEIVSRVTTVRGIGEWSAQMLLMFRLGRADILPTTDLGIQKGFMRIFGGKMPTPEKIARRGERWKPWRSVASWYLWRAVD